MKPVLPISLFRPVLALLAALAPLPLHAADPAGRECDLFVVEATPAGVAMSVRAAREGLTVVLIQHNNHVGGMLTNGLGLWDTIMKGARSPLYDELSGRFREFYRTTYGEDSPQWKIARSTRGKFEPKVAEKIVEDMIRAEKNITLLKGWIPVSAERDGSLLRSVTIQTMDGRQTQRIRAQVFADASYEGDLLPVAKVPYRVGREARTEYNEAHAGRIFTKVAKAQPKEGTIVGSLNLSKYEKTQKVLPGGTGEGDKAIQAFNFRVILTNDPANRLIPSTPPPGYNAAAFESIRERWSINTGSVPNAKGNWNAPLLIEGNWDYPEADWKKRDEITARHRDFALGLLWFLQNDPQIPEAKRLEAKNWGLARDEFTDNGNMPYEMYVREARRLVGRQVFTENDALVAPGLERAPIQPDAIAITEWPLDSHECRLERVPGSVGEGKVLLTEDTVPGQVPYDCLLPQGVDNMLVPMCLSATHIGWGTIRLEPTVMNIAESAAYAAVTAVKTKTPPALIEANALVRLIAERKVGITFFNDVDLGLSEPWVAAVEYFGAKGFFNTYNARPADPLTTATANVWLRIFKLLKQGESFDPTELARALPKTEPAGGPALTQAEFAKMFGLESSAPADQPVTRSAACAALFAALAR